MYYAHARALVASRAYWGERKWESMVAEYVDDLKVNPGLLGGSVESTREELLKGYGNYLPRLADMARLQGFPGWTAHLHGQLVPGR